MRHTGLQQFTNTDTTGEAKTFNLNILNQLSVPLHRPLDGPVLGDLFFETNNLKVVNNDNEVNQLLDLGNSDIIKSLLVSEILFDEFLNYNKPLEEANSFHNKIDVNSEQFIQIEINNTFDCTTNQDDLPTIEVYFEDNLLAERIFTNLLELGSNDIPIHTTFDSTNIHMVYYDNILYDNVNNKILVILNSSFNEIVLSDITNTEITEISIDMFLLVDNEVRDNYIGLPNHYHQLKDINDMTSNTNTENGFIKLNNSEIKLDFPYKQFVDKFGVNNSLLEKDQSDNILKKKLFDIKITNDSFNDEIVYTDTTIDLGNDEYAIEYTFTEYIINSTDTIELSTNDNQELNITNNFSITDTTAHQHSYLVEFLKFDFSKLISPLNQGVINPFSLTYLQIPKSEIDTPNLQIYKINDTTITTINCYQDIQIIQPNINTVPFTLIQRTNLYKDDQGNIQLTIPTIYKSLSGEKHFTIKGPSDLYIDFDTTAFPINLDIYILDLITNEQTLVDTQDLTDSKKRKTISRGRIKVVPSTLLNSYTFTIFDKTS